MTTLRLPLTNSQVTVPNGWSRWLVALSVLTISVAFWAIWVATANTLTVTVDGVTKQVRSHRRTVGDVLLDQGLRPQPADRVIPSADTRLAEATHVQLIRATNYLISIDGQLLDIRSWGQTVGDVLAEGGLTVNPYDSVLINDVEVELTDTAPMPVRSVMPHTFARSVWRQTRTEPIRIRVNRALPITVDDGTLPYEINTTAQTVGEALRQAQIPVYLGDVVQPSLGSEVLSTMRVTIHRSQPVSFDVGGRIIRTRTRGETVADALAEAEIGLSALDEVTPPLDNELRANEHIEVVRVLEDVEIEEEIAPYTTVYVPDATLPIDTQQLVSPGAEGITRTRYRVRYEDGVEVARTLEDTWKAQEPADRSIAYGQRIEPKTFTAANGTQYMYWRKVRMLASSYSASTAGVSPDKAYYGRTYTGEPMRFGIVAVDPTIIPLRSKVFVTGYGEGDALDIGSAIRARRIDLGYDDSNLVLWNRWVDVYLLWPPPSNDQITWVLPNWPRPPE